MPATVEDELEISLGGVLYPLSRSVVSTLASIYPGKVVIGDTTKDSDQRRSVLALTDYTGGIGIDRVDSATEIDRAWWSTANIRHRNHLTLGPLAVTTADLGTPNTSAIGVIGEYKDEVYATFGTAVHKYNNSSDSWGSSLKTLPAAATDILNLRADITSTDVTGTDYLVIATTTGFTTYNGTVFADHIIDAKYLTSWDRKLWTIDVDGRLRYTTDLSVQTSQSGTVSGVETNGSAVLDDTGATFTATIRDGDHWVRVTDNGGDTVTGYIHTIDADSDNTKVNIYNSTSFSTQNWIEGDATAFDMADTPLTYNVYTMTDDAQLPLPNDFVTDLLVSRNAAGNPIVFAATLEGLFAHDFDGTKFVETEVGFPRHPDNGLGSLRWRDALYLPAGLSIYKFANGSNTAVVSLAGPDRDDGLPSDRRGTIDRLVGSQNELLAVIGIPINQTVQGLFDGSGLGTHISAVIADPNPRQASILGFNEIGWRVRWASTETAKDVTYAHVSSAYSEYRIWWAHDVRVLYMDLPRDITNPSHAPDAPFETSSTHETPWYSMGQTEVTKLACSIIAETEGMSSTETITIGYALDYVESYTSLTTITADGKTEYVLPNTTTPEGVAFRSIKFKVTFVRGTNNKISPDLTSLTLCWRKKLAAKYGFTAVVNMYEEYKGRASQELRSNLLTAVEGDLLVEFTFRDDDSNTRNFWVDVVSASGIEFSGHDERGETTILLVEI